MLTKTSGLPAVSGAAAGRQPPGNRHSNTKNTGNFHHCIGITFQLLPDNCKHSNPLPRHPATALI
jgi:hypothetical protein